MRYFIIAGEKSGDLHGSNLIRGLLHEDSEAEIICWGGDLMETAGGKVLVNYRETAFMGFVQVLKNLGNIRKNLERCKSHILHYNPDVVIFIDYPGFNLRVAAFARKNGFRTFYYISPKLWAWNEGRVKKIRDLIDKMFIIFPFEVEFYRRHGITVEYQGNPLVDEVEKKRREFPPAGEIRKELGTGDKPVIGLLAGSRKSEIEYVLPQMLKTVPHFPGHSFVLAGVTNITDEVYHRILGNSPVKLVRDRTYEVLNISEAALVTSGTATLEAALMGVPQVVCFRADFISMVIAWMVIKVKYISLVNLIMESEVIKELIQYDLNEKNLVNELRAIIKGGPARERIFSDYEELKSRLGPAGASFRAAAGMVEELRKAMGAKLSAETNTQNLN